MQCNCKLLVKCFAAQYCLIVFITFTLYVLEYRNNFLSSSVAATKTIKTARKIINACERPSTAAAAAVAVAVAAACTICTCTCAELAWNYQNSVHCTVSAALRLPDTFHWNTENTKYVVRFISALGF